MAHLHLEALGPSKTFLQEATVSMVGVRPLPLRTIMSMGPFAGDLQAPDRHHTVAPTPGEDLLLLEVVILNLLARREVVTLSGSAHLDVAGMSMTLTWRPSTMPAVARPFLLEEGLADRALVDQTW